MYHSPQQLQDLDEATLRKKVLIPLFERMEFKDVSHYHGGSGEQGKDIVMWKPGELGERLNYVVVVKAGSITGKADMGALNAGGVAFQINQALGGKYLDPKGGGLQQANFCWVVASNEIKKEAVASITSSISNSNLDRFVRFIDGAQLWKWVKQHFGASATTEALRSAKNYLESLDPDWKIVCSTDDSKSFQIIQKHDRARSLTFGLKLKIPNSDQGRAKAIELQEHVDKGTPATIEAKYIKEFILPDFLRDFMDDIEKIEMKPNPQGQKKINLRVKCGNEPKIYWERINLQIERAGVKEILWSNRGDTLPWIIEVLVDQSKKTVGLNFAFNFSMGNVHQSLEAAYLLDALAQDGEIEVELADSGILLLKIPPNSQTEKLVALKKDTIPLLERLDLIQKITQIELHLPTEMNGDFLAKAYFIYDILHEGGSEAKHFSISLSVNREIAEKILIDEQMSEAKSRTFTKNDVCLDFCGKSIHLGAISYLYSSAYLSPESLEKLKAELCNLTMKRFVIKFDPTNDSRIEAFCLSRISDETKVPDEIKNLLKMALGKTSG